MWSCQFSSSSQPIAQESSKCDPPVSASCFLPFLLSLSLLCCHSCQSFRRACQQAWDRTVKDKPVTNWFCHHRLQPITSWGGQQRAVRTLSGIVFLRKEPDPAAHTRASAWGGEESLCTGHAEVPQISQAARSDCKATCAYTWLLWNSLLLLSRFFFFLLRIVHCLGIVARQGGKNAFSDEMIERVQES